LGDVGGAHQATTWPTWSPMISGLSPDSGACVCPILR